MKKMNFNKIMSATLAALFMLPPSIARSNDMYFDTEHKAWEHCDSEEDCAAVKKSNSSNGGAASQQSKPFRAVISPVVVVNLPSANSGFIPNASDLDGSHAGGGTGAGGGVIVVTKTSGHEFGGVFGLTNSSIIGAIIPSFGEQMSRTFVGPAADLKDKSAEAPEKISDLNPGEQVTVVKSERVIFAAGAIAGVLGAGPEKTKMKQKSVTVARNKKGQLIATVVSANHEGLSLVGGVVVLAGKDSKVETPFQAWVLEIPATEAGESFYKQLVDARETEKNPKAIEAIVAAGVAQSKVKVLKTEGGLLTTKVAALALGIPLIATKNSNQTTKFIEKGMNENGKLYEVVGFETARNVENEFFNVDTNSSIGMSGSLIVAAADKKKKEAAVMTGEISMSYSTDRGSLYEFKNAMKRMAAWTGIAAVAKATDDQMAFMSLVERKDDTDMKSFSAKLGIKISDSVLQAAMTKAANNEFDISALKEAIKVASLHSVYCLNNKAKNPAGCDERNVNNQNLNEVFPYGQSLSALDAMIGSLVIMAATKDQAAQENANGASRKKFIQAYADFAKAMTANSVAFGVGLSLLGSEKVGVELDVKGTKMPHTQLVGVSSAESVQSVVLLAGKKDKDDKSHQVEVSQAGARAAELTGEQAILGIAGAVK
jgi:hypothetical protein